MSTKMMKRLPCAVLAASALLGLSACSEVPQVTVYEQGQYRGKSDARPWEGGEFKGDRAAWVCWR